MKWTDLEERFLKKAIEQNITGTQIAELYWELRKPSAIRAKMARLRKSNLKLEEIEGYDEFKAYIDDQALRKFFKAKGHKL